MSVKNYVCRAPKPSWVSKSQTYNWIHQYISILLKEIKSKYKSFSYFFLLIEKGENWFYFVLIYLSLSFLVFYFCSLHTFYHLSITPHFQFSLFWYGHVGCISGVGIGPVLCACVCVSFSASYQSTDNCLQMCTSASAGDLNHRNSTGYTV